MRMMTRARLSQDYIKGFVAAPEDRRAALGKLMESVGAKLIDFYFTAGDSDFVMISEAETGEQIIAAVMGAKATGSIYDVSTVRAWTTEEFKQIGEMAQRVGSAYRVPGRG